MQGSHIIMSSLSPSLGIRNSMESLRLSNFSLPTAVVHDISLVRPDQGAFCFLFSFQWGEKKRIQIHCVSKDKYCFSFCVCVYSIKM